DPPRAADRFSGRHQTAARPERGGTVLLYQLRQAVRHQEHDRARHGEARRRPLDVQECARAAANAEDVRRLPRDRDHVAVVRSLRRAGAPEAAHLRGLFARAREAGAEGLKAIFAASPFAGTRPAPCGPPDFRSSAPASSCPAYRSPDRSRTISTPTPASTRWPP